VNGSDLLVVVVLVDHFAGERFARHGWNDDDWRTGRSAFWRVVKKTTLALGIATDPDAWPSRLAYSNLYKLSPKDGGNPSGRLQEVQRLACIKMFLAEIEAWRPKRVLMLTDLKWASPFLQGLASHFGTEIDSLRITKFVQCTLQIPFGFRRGLIVVGRRPECKKEAPAVEEICEAFSAC
jgi:hypothetical protein